MTDKAKRIELPPLPRRGLYEVDIEKVAADTKPKTRRDATRKGRPEKPEPGNNPDSQSVLLEAAQVAASTRGVQALVEESGPLRDDTVPVVKKVRKAKAVLAVAEKKAKPLAAKKPRGRPKAEVQEPWVLLGISKATYYRQQKAKANG